MKWKNVILCKTIEMLFNCAATCSVCVCVCVCTHEHDNSVYIVVACTWNVIWISWEYFSPSVSLSGLCVSVSGQFGFFFLPPRNPLQHLLIFSMFHLSSPLVKTTLTENMTMETGKWVIVWAHGTESSKSDCPLILIKMS